MGAPDNTVLIVGAGQAGGQTARALAAQPYPGRIVICGDEAHPPYERPPLSKGVLKGASAHRDVYLWPDEEWAAAGIEVILADGVIDVDYTDGTARLQSGKTIPFGTLVIATGGRSRQLALPGACHCLHLRDLDDSRTLNAALTSAETIAVIGGGVIGMEIAAAAREMAKAVTVIEAGPRVMSRVLSPAASEWLAQLHRTAGIEILTGCDVRDISPHGHGFAVTLTDRTITADIVVSAVGMSPNTRLAPPGSIGAMGGIVTDAEGRVTGFENVFAIGDVAETWNALYGRAVRLETWRNADKQARAVAKTIAGTPTAHSETPWMWTDQLGHNIQVVGMWNDTFSEVAKGEFGESGSTLLWMRDGTIVGGVLLDNGRERRFLEQLVARATPLDDTRLADPSVKIKDLA